MNILIKITKSMLERSMHCGLNAEDISSNCVIAMAIRDIFPQACVSSKIIYPFYYVNGMESIVRDTEHIIDLPQIARNYIIVFDLFIAEPEKRLKMPEISFEIVVPSPIIEKVGISQAYKILSESKTLECVSL